MEICNQGHVLDAGATICSRCGWSAPEEPTSVDEVVEDKFVNDEEVSPETTIEEAIKVVKKAPKKKAGRPKK